MEPLNPVQVENRIRELVNHISKGVKIYSKTYASFQSAARLHDHAYASAYLMAEGPVEDRKQRARLQSEDAREAMDLAEQEFKYADRMLKALELELRAYQSIGVSVRSAYGVAGRGEF